MARPAEGASAGASAEDPLLELLEALSSAPGVSGHEAGIGDGAGVMEGTGVTEVVRHHLGAWCDEVRTDRLGNLIGLRRARTLDRAGTGARAPRIMLAAHMDEIGMLVSRIEKGGFLRVAPVGGVNVQALLGQVVRVHAREGVLAGVLGLKPPHLTDRKEMQKFPRWDDLFVDLGLPEEEVRRKVEVGDLVSIHARPLQLMGGRLAGKALDNRAGVAVLIEALHRLSALQHCADVYPVATVQEEVGLRGAMVSAFGIVPDVAVAVDVTFARQRGVDEAETPVELGKGPALAVGANVHPRVGETLVKLAREHGVPHQVEAIPGRSGTDAWAIQVSQSGVATGLVSVPLRYMHSAVELVDVEDVRQAGRLLSLFCQAVTAEWVASLAEWGA